MQNTRKKHSEILGTITISFCQSTLADVLVVGANDQSAFLSPSLKTGVRGLQEHPSYFFSARSFVHMGTKLTILTVVLVAGETLIRSSVLVSIFVIPHLPSS